MKCQVCGAESGKYPLCRECNKKKEAGEVIKCPKCSKWHLASMDCREAQEIIGKTVENDMIESEAGEKDGEFLYERKQSLVTKTEMEYLKCIKKILPENCLIQPQANLASFIRRTDGAKFQNELYRNVDFIVTDLSYSPLFLVEINDQTHLTNDRKQRDKKVANICEEAGIPIIKLWTSYGVNQEYIQKRVLETLSSLPVKRIHHFEIGKEVDSVLNDVQETQKTVDLETERIEVVRAETTAKSKKGCYIATCVYGSYDCPQVWTLRRFRDMRLERSWIGRCFINLYYAVSPGFVKTFGNCHLFQVLWKKFLDQLVQKLHEEGIADTPYTDRVNETWKREG